MTDLTMKGADVFIYINNNLFTSAQSINYTIDSQEDEIYGGIS